VDDLSARTEGELLAIENLGPQSVSQIKDRLADRGRHLAEPGPAAATATAGAAAAGSATAGGAAAGSSADATGTATVPPGPWADGTAPPRGARPPDEDAIDLLSVAGFPVLKRALPVVGVVAVLLLIVLGIRRRGRRPSP
jgi:hypothetical protein